MVIGERTLWSQAAAVAGLVTVVMWILWRHTETPDNVFPVGFGAAVAGLLLGAVALWRSRWKALAALAFAVSGLTLLAWILAVLRLRETS